MPKSVIAVITTKGGAGKSTMVAHVAVAAAQRRRKPFILDFDKKQLSLVLWGKGLRKSTKSPVIKAGTVENLRHDIAVAKRAHDLIIIDVAAGGGDEVREVATLADHILIPVKPSAFDVSAMKNTVDLLRGCADNTEPEEIAYRNALGKAAIVLNSVPAKQTLQWKQGMHASLAASGAGSLPIIATLTEREAFRNALAHGQGVTEVKEKPDRDAIAEIQALYRALTALEHERESKLKRLRVGK